MTLAVSIIAILAALMLARGLKWLMLDGKPRIDTDYTQDLTPAAKPWRRVTVDEER